ncbi:MAG: SUMF1/EgtB/PvdO family nonheme iron enzyme, partial [Blastocatellia bacterium]
SDPKTFSRYLRQHPRGDYADKAKARFYELTETAYWQSIADSSSVDQFGEYLKRYPEGRYASQAKARSDELTEVALWDSIASTRNKDAFNDYLKKYPSGRFTAQAKARLDTLVEIEYWSSIASSAKPEPFAEYLRRYPNGLFARQAMDRYNDLAEVAYWNSISASYDPQQLSDYLAKYPNGHFAGIAKERIARQKDNIAWTAVANSSDTQAIKGYLSQFPDGQYSTAAKDRITQLEETADWSAIAGSSDPEAFNGFLKKHPNSELAPVAKAMYEERKETALWKSIATTSDPEPVKEYLKLYPTGRFVEAAKNRLSELDASPAPAAAATRTPAESANQPAEKPASTPVATSAQPSRSSGEPEKKPAARPNGSESTPSASGGVSTNTNSRAASGLVLQAFEFNMLNFTEPGLKPNLVKGKAAYFAEDLGGPILKLVQVPGGSYLMGDSDLVMERPQHQAAVSPFFMGEFEVTQAEWRVVASLPKVGVDLNPDPSYFKGDDLPVGNVSWDEAVEFCARLSKKTGHVYRLPTEAEWEYACRAGTTTPFSFGDNITADYVNFDGEHPYKNGPQGERRLKPVPVGSLGAANAFGLFDMHGNALEWCSDEWHDNYIQAPADGSSWNSGGDPNKRVLRGGDWTQPASRARSSARTAGEEKARSFNWGFRVVMEPR